MRLLQSQLNFGVRRLDFLSLDQATDIVQSRLNEVTERCGQFVVLEDATQSHDFGWVFFYTSAKFLGTRSVADLLAGNAPVICLRATGECFETGTAEPVQNYVERFQLAGDPHAVLEPKVQIVSWRYGADKVQATKLIKAEAGVGLKEAKQHIDVVLAGEHSVVELPSIDSVERVVSKLSEYGFVVERSYSAGAA